MCQFLLYPICRDFSSLEFVDQEKLLSQNTPLFVQFFLGHNLLVESRHKSTRDTNVEEKSKKKKVWTSHFAQKLNLEWFNSMTHLYVNGTDFDVYGKLILKLKGLPEFINFEQMAILAYILALNPSNLEGSRLKYFDDLFNKYIRSCDNCLTLPVFIHTLTSMANFSSDNFNCVKK